MTDVSASQILSLIDLTLLGDADTLEEIDKLCAASVTPFGAVAAVCVWPRFVGRSVSNLHGPDVPVAAVANFPAGDNNPDQAVSDAKAIVAAGGSEVDVVFPWKSLTAGEKGVGQTLVEATRHGIGDNVLLKVILETGELQDPNLIRAAALEAIAGGADFLKTSTGKTQHGADLNAAEVLFKTVLETDRSVGVKISGGVRTISDAVPYLELAADVLGPTWIDPTTFRFGASALLDDVISEISRSSG